MVCDSTERHSPESSQLTGGHTCKPTQIVPPTSTFGLVCSTPSTQLCIDMCEIADRTRPVQPHLTMEECETITGNTLNGIVLSEEYLYQ